LRKKFPNLDEFLSCHVIKQSKADDGENSSSKDGEEYYSKEEEEEEEEKYYTKDVHGTDKEKDALSQAKNGLRKAEKPFHPHRAIEGDNEYSRGFEVPIILSVIVIIIIILMIRKRKNNKASKSL